jgi:hypothetical protein
MTYIGQRYGTTDYYYPNNTFFSDLARHDATFSRDILTLTLSDHDPPQVHRVRVFHLLSDSRIIPQTKQMFDAVRGLRLQHKIVNLPHIQENFLALPFGSLSERDQSFLRQTIQTKLGLFLKDVFVEKMNIDQVVQEIETPIMHTSTSLGSYLERIARLFFFFDPRYGFNALFTGFNERVNMFYYRLAHLADLPVEFFYPQYAILENTADFDRLLSDQRQCFIQELLARLFYIHYPFLKFIPKKCVVRPFQPVFHTPHDDSLTLYVPYKRTFRYLPDVAHGIIHHDELSLDHAFLDSIAFFFDLDRVRHAYAAVLQPSGFELSDDHVDISAVVASHDISASGPHVIAPLPEFKTRALVFLDSM